MFFMFIMFSENNSKTFSVFTSFPLCFSSLRLSYRSGNENPLQLSEQFRVMSVLNNYQFVFCLNLTQIIYLVIRVKSAGSGGVAILGIRLLMIQSRQLVRQAVFVISGGSVWCAAVSTSLCAFLSTRLHRPSQSKQKTWGSNQPGGGVLESIR